MKEELKNKFPSIVEARVCINQKEYEYAVEIYSEVLEEARKHYEETSLLMCYLYLEYSSALISLSFETNFNRLQRMANRESFTLENGNDLEIAWELLEISRITFTEINDSVNLNRTYYLLGEVLLNDNKIEEALSEYNKCINTDEVLYRKALCYEFLNDYPKAISILKSINTLNSELMNEIKEEISLLEGKLGKENNVELEQKINNINEEEVMNVDSLIKKK